MRAGVASTRRRWLRVLWERALRTPLLPMLVTAAACLSAAPAPLPAQEPPAAETVGPCFIGWVDVGPPLAGATVHLVAADGTKIAGPALTDRGGFYYLAIGDMPANARVVATGGTYGASPFQGTLTALVERREDGSARPTYVTLATTLQVAMLDATPGMAPEDAEAQAGTILGFDRQVSLGMDVALADDIVPQDQLLRVAAANGGFDAFVQRVARREPEALELVPKPRFDSSPAAAASEGPTIASGGLADQVTEFLLGKAKELLLRKLGFDREPDQLAQIENQLRFLQAQLVELGIKIDHLAEQIKAEALLSEISRYRIAYGHSIREGWAQLAEVTRKGADLEEARRDGGRDRLREAERAFTVAVNSFDDACSKGRFGEAPLAFTDQFKSSSSLLQRYVDVFMRPKRYLTSQDSLAFSDFFYSYYLTQIQALRLHAECLVRKAPDTEDAVFDQVFGRQNPHSNYNRAQIGQLPSVMPQLLPGAELVFPPTGEPVVLDVATGLLWWNGTYVGRHRDQKLKPEKFIPSHATDVPQGANGTWEFELAKAAEIRKLVDLLGAPKPLVWSRGTPGLRFPDRLSPFLAEIGLERVAPHATVFVWARERFMQIKMCYKVALDNNGVGVCVHYYGDDFGYTGVAIQNDGRQTSVPLICGARGCDRDGFPYDRLLTLCPVREGPYLPHCMRHERFLEYEGPGLYRATPLPRDRFATVDMTVLH